MRSHSIVGGGCPNPRRPLAPQASDQGQRERTRAAAPPERGHSFERRPAKQGGGVPHRSPKVGLRRRRVRSSAPRASSPQRAFLLGSSATLTQSAEGRFLRAGSAHGSDGAGSHAPFAARLTHGRDEDEWSRLTLGPSVLTQTTFHLCLGALGLAVEDSSGCGAPARWAGVGSPCGGAPFRLSSCGAQGPEEGRVLGPLPRALTLLCSERPNCMCTGVRAVTLLASRHQTFLGSEPH